MAAQNYSSRSLSEKSPNTQTISNSNTKIADEQRKEFSQEEFRKDIKTEVEKLKTNIDQKLQDIAEDIQSHNTRLNEMEERITGLESENVELKDTLLHALKEQKTMQGKITDLEAGGASMFKFINGLLKMELSLNDDLDLQIQRAHRSLGPRLQNDATSRSIIVDFMQYSTKDLGKSVGKRNTIRGQTSLLCARLSSGNNAKLKEYKEVKRVLKENKISFQMPYPAKIRIHWETGPQLYDSAAEVAGDLNKRGYAVDLTAISEGSERRREERLVRHTQWQKVRNSVHNRIREKLRGFQRQLPTTD
ncbi:hypothetical protein M9458_056918 [Cirrhinus mrigala]|uniref:L1 transposable element RRM domain-containing protein n=1 Tax=Cirrhinus mrigala TaxID=683832 RepID=A0ABD0MDS0_CIRMR